MRITRCRICDSLFASWSTCGPKASWISLSGAKRINNTSRSSFQFGASLHERAAGMLWYAIGVKSNCHAGWAVHGSLVVNGQGEPVDTDTDTEKETDTETETETEVLGTSPAACHLLCIAFVPLQLLSILFDV